MRCGNKIRNQKIACNWMHGLNYGLNESIIIIPRGKEGNQVSKSTRINLTPLLASMSARWLPLLLPRTPAAPQRRNDGGGFDGQKPSRE